MATQPVLCSLYDLLFGCVFVLVTVVCGCIPFGDSILCPLNLRLAVIAVLRAVVSTLSIALFFTASYKDGVFRGEYLMIPASFIFGFYATNTSRSPLMRVDWLTFITKLVLLVQAVPRLLPARVKLLLSSPNVIVRSVVAAVRWWANSVAGFFHVRLLVRDDVCYWLVWGLLLFRFLFMSAALLLSCRLTHARMRVQMMDNFKTTPWHKKLISTCTYVTTSASIGVLAGCVPRPLGTFVGLLCCVTSIGILTSDKFTVCMGCCCCCCC